MSLIFRKVAGYAVRKIASNPVARQKAAEAARHAAGEVKNIAGAENKAYEAGRSVKRVLNKLKNDEM